MNVWPPLQPISDLITEIEFTGITLQAVDGKIRSTPSGKISPSHLDLLRSRRVEVLQFLENRPTALTHTEGRTDPGVGGASPAAAPAAAADAPATEPTSTLFLLYEAIDGNEYAIPNDDYDLIKSVIWGPEDLKPLLHPMKRNGRKRYVMIPDDDAPTCWLDPRIDWSENKVVKEKGAT